MTLTSDQVEFLEDFFEELIYILSDKFVKKYKVVSIEELRLEANAKDSPQMIKLNLRLILIRKNQT